MNSVIPMFALTGHPQKQDIEREIKAFCSVGIGEVLIYPRSGCLVPYLSEEWFNVVSDTISVCEENNMKIWLYDEFNWPSGSCGNRIQKESHLFWSKKLIQEDGAIKIVSDSRFPDLLNPDSVKTFIRFTHEAYYTRFKDKFGKVIRGIFTDEPCFNYIAENTNQIVFYEGMEEEYKKAYGSDLFADASLYYDNRAPKDFILHVNDLLGARMKNCYIGRLADWCKTHGVLLTGHLLDDHAVARGIRSNGSTMEVLKEIHIPGIDDIQTRIRGGMLTTYAHIDCVKRAKGGETMIELFALGPCNMTFNRKKRSLYMAAAFGISNYFIAVAHLDAKGNYHLLRHFFNAECSMTPDYKATALFCKEAEKAAAFAKKESAPAVLVEYPRTQIAEYFNAQHQDKADACEAVLQNLFMELLNAQVSFGFTEEKGKDNALRVTAEGVYEAKTDKKVTDIAAWCNEKVVRTVSVLENGALAKGVFVTTYADGTFIIADCTEEEGKKREVEIHAGGKVYNTVLYPRQVLLKEDLTDLKAEKAENPTFSVSYKNGVLRPYLWEPFTFEVKDEVRAKFFVRIYPEQKELLLDGKPIAADKGSTELGNGLDNLYKVSAPVTLSKGTHVLSAADGKSEERLYLPICIIMGDFESEKNEIRKRKTEGNSAFFYGTCMFEAKIKVPIGAKTMKFETSDCFTRVFANGKEIGESAESAAVIPIPDSLSGTEVSFAFEQTGTLAPLFGETENDYCIKINQTPEWNIGFGTKQIPGGISNIMFEK